MKKFLRLFLPVLILLSLSACVVEHDHERIVTVTNQMGVSLVVSVNTIGVDEPTVLIPSHASVDFITNDSRDQVLHYKVLHSLTVYNVDMDLYAYHSYVDILGTEGDIVISE
ncbi:MAG: hypothetical protein J6Y79_04395 [Paludibacteraceae bacterium]|nr:hypothetical protein [Paludibacteraceae bacterium]